MTTINAEKCTCGNCGATVFVRVVTSTNAMGYPDLDLRPPEMKRSTMQYWVQECRECGYVNRKIETDATPYKELIASDEYVNCGGYGFNNPLTRRFYKSALIAVADGDFDAAFSAFLNAARASDDSLDIEEAIICRKKAISVYDGMTDATNEHRMVQRADLLRRAGEFDRLIAEYSDAEYSEEVLNDVIAFHLAKAKEKDSACYTIADVYSE